jgi:predicted dehydrogenase
MKPVRVAVVGAGHLGGYHAQKIKSIAEANLVGVFDTDLAKSQALAQKIDCQIFKNQQEVINNVDAIMLASSTSSHYAIAKEYLTQGKHVFVEKPMTTTVEQGKELCEIAKKNKLILQVGHVERFNPALIAAREQLEIPLFIECHRLAPFKTRGIDVDVVLDLMIHDIDVVLSLVKSEVKSVAAVGTPILTKIVDIANARIEFENGTVANMTSSRVSQNTMRKFRVFQKTQYLSIDFGTGEVNLTTKTGDWDGDNLPLKFEAWNLEKGDALLQEDIAFIKAVRGEAPCLVTGEDGLKALNVAEQVRAEIQKKL